MQPEISGHLSLKQIRRAKESKLKTLKEVLMSDASPVVVKKYYIKLPTERAHHECHPTKGEMGLSQRVHPELISKVHEFVSIGTVEPVEIQRLLKHHVNHYMCAHSPPEPNDRAYYPTLDDIKNYVTKAKRALQLSVVDQDNAAKLIKQQQELSPESKYFFRPYQEVKNHDNSNLATISSSQPVSLEIENTLLWVHQEPWQQQLMIRYGNTMSLMDATYKTTRYDLPLFFVCVRTNSGYCVVAEFIVQSESAIHIEEALQILISWNSEWKPKFFMTDFSEAEIKALETCFPDSKVYLCDFHREQAWERWTRDSKHGLSSSDSELLLDQLRACAWAPSPDTSEGLQQDHYYKKAVDALKASSVWENNEHVSQWLTTTWLCMPEVSNRGGGSNYGVKGEGGSNTKWGTLPPLMKILWLDPPLCFPL